MVLFTRSQLVGGWHLFLSDWKAMRVSLLKEKNKKKKTEQYLISIDEISECVEETNITKP